MAGTGWPAPATQDSIPPLRSGSRCRPRPWPRDTPAGAARKPAPARSGWFVAW